MTSGRSSTANDASPSRMPFPSAEALLWGPEMKKQHAYLFTEMRALQKQHGSYDARIRATETVAEAVEAAIARINDLEGQLTDIVDTNKDLRQKQSELETKVSHMSENLERFSCNYVGVKDVLRRLDLLEHDRREDAERIHGLEREVERLSSMRKNDNSRPVQSRTGLESREESREGLIQSVELGAGISDLTTESDHEESLLPRLLPGVLTQEEIQVPQSLEVQETEPGSTHIPPPTNAHSIISARRRLLQRPSIHDAKLQRHMEEQNAQTSPGENPGPSPYHSSPPPTQVVSRKHWDGEPAPAPLPTPTPVPAPSPAPATQRQTRGRSKANALTSEAPPTQLVERKPPGKRKQPDSGPSTQRQTRSQAKKNQVKEEELQRATGSHAIPETQPAQKTEPVSPSRKKLKVPPAKQRAGNKVKPSETSQSTSRNARKTQNQCKVEEASEQEPVISDKSASTTARSRKTKATASCKKNPTPAPPQSASTNPREQERLMVKIGPGQRAQEDINATQEQISASYSYYCDEL